MSARELITDHLDLWTGAVTTRSTAGRGRNGKIELTGIKKLRELILELAVCGKLVEQDPNDEPASVLLERIAEEKARLVKEGKIKKPKKLPEITEEDRLFELPDSWEWVRLGDLCELENGDRSKNYPNKSSLVETGIPFVNAGHLQNHSINTSELTFITEEKFNLLRSGKFRDGDILFCLRGSLGKFGVVRNIERGAVASSLIIARPYLSLLVNYTELYLKAPISEIMIRRYDNGTAQPNLSGADFSKFLIPFPGESEQHRIVKKVDELMALCDRLEQQVGDQLEAHEVLVDTLLYALTRSADASEVAENWVRIAEHFDTLFTTEASIDKLKQTILQLAVMGRLVEQGPNDEPASVLLERIAEEKARLAKEGKIKKPKSLPEVDAKDLGQTPNGWRSVRFGELMLIRSELVKALDYPELDQVAPDSIEKGTGRLLYRRTVKESGAKGPNNKFHRGQILYSKIRPSLSKAVIAEFDGLCSADMYPINSLINSRYLLLVILSEPFLSQVRTAENRIKMPKLNIESLSNIVVGLPPEAEQYRIVEKLDELMALCDQLKARLGEASETRTHLAEAVVEQAVS